MKVKVLKSSEDTYWYAKHIGQEFEVHEKINRHGEYDLVEELGGSIYSIGADDCEIVKPST
jgi:hypothetical protein